MAKVTYVDHSGSSQTVDVENGMSVMQAALHNGIAGIDAVCGGACACATCQVYVDEAWLVKLTEPSEDELSMLEFAANAQSNSRLSCQILMKDELDGLVVHTPASQF